MADCHFGYIINLTIKTFKQKREKNAIMHDLKRGENQIWTYYAFCKEHQMLDLLLGA